MNKRITLHGLLLLLMQLPFLAHGQGAYSLQKCIEIALKRNTQLNITRRTNDINSVNLTQSKYAQYPSLNANASQAFSFGKSLDPSTYQYVNQNIASNVFAITSSFVLFNGGELVNTIKLNNALVDAGNMDISTFQNTVILGVTASYVQILLDNELIGIAKDAIDRDQKQIDITKVMVNAGSVPELNLFQVQSQMAADQLTLTNAQNQLALDRLTIEQLMNQPDSSSFDIVKPPLPEPPATLDQTPASALYNNSVEAQPQVKSTELKMAAAKYAFDVARGAMYPRLALNSSISTNYSSSRSLISDNIFYQTEQIGYTQGTPSALVYGIVPEQRITKANYPFFNQLGDNIGEGFTFSLTIPIFNNYIIRANEQQALINQDVAKLNDEYTRELFRKTIEQAYTDMQGTNKQYNSSKEALRTETEAFKTMQTKYDNGAANATDLVLETNKYTTAQSQVAQAKCNFLYKQKVLDFYLGKSILF